MLTKEEIINKLKQFSSLGINIIPINESKLKFETTSLKNNKYLKDDYYDNCFIHLVRYYVEYKEALEEKEKYTAKECLKKFNRICQDIQNFDQINIYIFIDIDDETLNTYIEVVDKYIKIINDEFEENPLFEEINSLFKKDYSLLFKKEEKCEKFSKNKDIYHPTTFQYDKLKTLSSNLSIMDEMKKSLEKEYITTPGLSTFSTIQ